MTRRHLSPRTEVLFNSFTFLLGFLPLTVLLLFSAKAFAPQAFLPLLLVASLVFYGWWYPPYVLLFGFSLLVNFLAGLQIQRTRSKRWLVAGVTFNLALLAYFKYASFLVANVNRVLDTHLSAGAIPLPLAISFFTFQFITYLVDISRGKITSPSLRDTALFVAFFPHFIAGPIVRYTELVPQLKQSARRMVKAEDLFVAVVLFTVGLFKKVVIADTVAQAADVYFGVALNGQPLTFIEGWLAALSYGMQIYFDFSGYSDMALGLARLFGVRLPLNFNSPYQATNASDFWRRWHITLSRFLRDFLYIPLGGNRKGQLRRYFNLAVVMLLGGLWHGAGWTFVAWGGLHGLYLGCQHMFEWLRARLPEHIVRSRRFGPRLAQAITFLGVTVAWVFFRAPDFATATRILRGMVGLSGVVVPSPWWAVLPPRLAALLRRCHISAGDVFGYVLANQPGIEGQMLLLALLLIVTTLMPNVYVQLYKWQPALDFGGADRAHHSSFPISTMWGRQALGGLVMGLMLFAAIKQMAAAPPSVFVYFNF